MVVLRLAAHVSHAAFTFDHGVHPRQDAEPDEKVQRSEDRCPADLEIRDQLLGRERKGSRDGGSDHSPSGPGDTNTVVLELCHDRRRPH